MFFLVQLNSNVELPPNHFHKNYRAKLIETLIKQKEGSFLGDYGYIVLVTKVHEVGKGKIRDGIAPVSFPIEYQALCFRPLKNEVVDGVVKQVEKFGFFVTVGPLQVFVSKHQIPPEYELDESVAPPVYVSKDDPSARIGDGVEVRIKLIGMRVEVSEMQAIGTIAEDYLGPLQ